MKNLILLALSFLTIAQLSAQQNLSGTITHDGLQREYLLYIPDSFEAGKPLVFNLHGYTSTALAQLFYGDFRSIADTAGFMIVCPQGTEDNLGITHWNVGWGTSTVDDVSFVSALIDSIYAEYGIDLDRVFSTGMSNGGFMSYVLACQLSERIAAIASVTGTMNLGSFGTCDSQHPMPVMEIHGTADGTVPYAGDFWIESSEDVGAYWAGFNGITDLPLLSSVPDIDPNDGCTAEHWLYGNGENGAEVELYKILGGEHTWPGSAFINGVTNNDFDASTEIWRFFSKYDLNGLIEPNGVDDYLNVEEQLNLSPNPSDSYLIIQWGGEATDFQITDLSGRLIENAKLAKGVQQIEIGSYTSGEYVFTVQGQARRFSIVR